MTKGHFQSRIFSRDTFKARDTFYYKDGTYMNDETITGTLLTELLMHARPEWESHLNEKAGLKLVNKASKLRMSEFTNSESLFTDFLTQS